jgi:hypothetical protein
MRTLRRASAPGRVLFLLRGHVGAGLVGDHQLAAADVVIEEPGDQDRVGLLRPCETAAGHRRRVCAVMIAACSGRTISRAPCAAA